MTDTKPGGELNGSWNFFRSEGHSQYILRFDVAFDGEALTMGKGKKKGHTNRPKGIAKRLFFQEICLGEITDVYGESHWMSATLTPTSDADSFKEFFRWMVDEANVSIDPPFDEALLNEENWFVEQEDGAKVGISVPAVQVDSEIGWRWR